MVKEVTRWEDSKGSLWDSQKEALDAEEKYRVEQEITDIVTILQTTTKQMGSPGLPKSSREAAVIAIKAYPAMKEYYKE